MLEFDILKLAFDDLTAAIFYVIIAVFFLVSMIFRIIVIPSYKKTLESIIVLLKNRYPEKWKEVGAPEVPLMPLKLTKKLQYKHLILIIDSLHDKELESLVRKYKKLFKIIYITTAAMLLICVIVVFYAVI